MRVKGSNRTTKAAHAETTSNALAEQTAAFLKQGGKIEQIPRGQSGQQNISYFRRSGSK